MKDIIISNKKELDEKIKKFVSDGKEKFHVLADFDRTLTKCFINKKKTSSIISQLRREGRKYLTDDYAKQAHALFDEYHPIEINPDLSIEEKAPKMYEWWKKHKELLIKCGFDKKTIIQAVNEIIEDNSLVFRKKSEDFFKLLKQNKIPLIIMSSSLEDLITEFMKQKEVLSDNVHVISNAFEFDENGKAIKIERIIHVFNKHEMSIKHLPIYDDLLERKNVLLLGDSLGDLGMIKGFDYDEIIRIGFLNENVEGNLEKYKESFDIVIINDSDMNYVNELLNEIIS